jgi:heat shock protein HslJ
VGRTFASSSVTEGDDPRELIEGKPITLRFERSPGCDWITWEASCNGFGARVEIKAKRLLVGEIGQTLIGCPRESVEQDEWLSEFFAANPQWFLGDGRLTIQSGTTAIEFEPTNR